MTPPKKRRAPPGEGSVYYRASDSRWVAALTHDGRRRVLYARTEQEARRKLRDALHDAERGRAFWTDGTATVQRLSEAFLRTWRTRGLSANTLASYESILRHQVLPRIGHLRLRSLNAHRLQALEHALLERRPEPLAPSTVALTHRVLHALFTYGVAQGVLADNPLRGVRPPAAPPSAGEPLREDEARRLLATAERDGDPLLPLWRLLLDTGLRIGEALALRWSDLTLTGRRPEVRVERRLASDRLGPPAFAPPKAHSRRAVPLSDATAELLQSLRAARVRELQAWPPERRGYDLVFATAPGDRGGPGNALSRHYTRKRLARALRAAGITDAHGHHDLRHSNATALLSRRLSTASVAKRLGHANPGITARVYDHVLRMQPDAGVAEITDFLDGAGADVTPEDLAARRRG